MDLLDQFKGQLPQVQGPTMFDGLIKSMEETKKLSNSKNVKELAKDESESANTVVEGCLGILKPINSYSFFLKDNESVKGVVHDGEGYMKDLNGLLKKIADINCITKYCMLAKYLRKIQEIVEQLEAYKKELEEKAQLARTQAIEWAKGKAAEAAKNMAGSALKAAGAKVAGALSEMKIW